MQYVSRCSSPLGGMLLAADGAGLTGAWFEGQKHFARGLGRTCARAVGGAAGRNPVSVLVPCHRVVDSGGSLTGYAGGLERERALPLLERAGAGHA